MNLHQLSAVIPIGCAIILAYYGLSKSPSAKALKPTLLILSIAGLIYGVIVFLLDEQSFRANLNPQLLTWLRQFKFFVGGLGSGAALASIFYGHWKVAWLLSRQAKELRVTGQSGMDDTR